MKKCNYISKEKTVYLIVFFVFCFYITLNLITKISCGNIDNDNYFMLAHGEYIIKNGFAAIEPFSMHSDFEFMFPQWLTAVIIYSIYEHIGVNGIVLFFSIIFIVAEFILYKLLELISGNNVLSAILAGIVMTLVSGNVFTTRPFVISLLIVLSELYVLEKYVKHGNIKYLAIIPLLSILEINLHNSLWIMILLMMLPYLVDGIINREFKVAPLTITFMTSALCALLNPYGLKAITYIFKSMVSIIPASGMIAELSPASINSNLGLITIMINFGVMVGLLMFHNCKIKLRYILLYLGTCLMALVAIRNSIFFYPISMVAYIFIYQDIKSDSIGVKMPKFIGVLTGTMILSCVLSFSLAGKTDISTSIKNSSIISTDAINWMCENEDTEGTSIYNNINDGAYLLFNGFNVYIDPRLEVYGKENNKKEDILTEYKKVRNADIYYKDFMNKYDFNVVLLNKMKDKHLLQSVKHDPDYTSVYEDEVAVIYEKNQSTEDKETQNGQK